MRPMSDAQCPEALDTHGVSAEGHISEEFATAFARSLFNESLIAIRREERKHLVQAVRYLVIIGGGRNSFIFSVNPQLVIGLKEIETRLKWFMQAAFFADDFFLLDDKDRNEGFSNQLSLTHEFELLGCLDGIKRAGNLVLIGGMTDRFPSCHSLAESVDLKLVGLRRVECAVRVVLPKFSWSLRIGEIHSFPLSVLKLRIGKEDVELGELVNEQGGVMEGICKWESEGDETDGGCSLLLKVGLLRFRLEDLVKMRVGTRVCFELPRKFDGILSFGDLDWAHVSVEMEERELKMTVESVLEEGE